MLTETDRLPSPSAAWLSYNTHTRAHTHTHTHTVVIDWHSQTHWTTDDHISSLALSHTHTLTHSRVLASAGWKCPLTEEEEKSLLTPRNQVNCYHKSTNGHVVSYEDETISRRGERGIEERIVEQRRRREERKLYLKNDAFPSWDVTRCLQF